MEAFAVALRLHSIHAICQLIVQVSFFFDCDWEVEAKCLVEMHPIFEPLNLFVRLNVGELWTRIPVIEINLHIFYAEMPNVACLLSH